MWVEGNTPEEWRNKRKTGEEGGNKNLLGSSGSDHQRSDCEEQSHEGEESCTTHL